MLSGIYESLHKGKRKEGYSLKYQENEIKAYCEEHGLKLIHIFRDEGNGYKTLIKRGDDWIAK